MIAYNLTWLANLRQQPRVKDDLSKGRISEAEFNAIIHKYPVGFYTPGTFARVGLFIVTCIVVSFGDGLIAIVAGTGRMIDTAAFPLILGLLNYAGLEVMVRSSNHYKSGVDDALLYSSASAISTAIVMLCYNSGGGYIAIFALCFLLALVLTIRFADMLMSAGCCICFFALIYFIWTNAIPSGMATVPFALMIVSACAYWLVYTNRNKYVNYENCLAVAQVVCLVTLYAAGNYYIIQTLSDELHNGTDTPVPFGAFFWLWTIALPFIYVAFGIKRKDAILLRTGLMLIIAAALTFRNYYHIMPLDITLTIVGALLLGIAYGIMRYLKTPKHGFTYAEQEDGHMMDHLKVESLIIAESFSSAPSAPADTGTKFGGGDFGGGGSSSSF